MQKTTLLRHERLDLKTCWSNTIVGWLHPIWDLVWVWNWTTYGDWLCWVPHFHCPSWIVVELYHIDLNCRERQPNEALECSKFWKQIKVVTCHIKPKRTTHKIDVCYLDTILSASASHRIWNTRLVWDDLLMQIVPVAICLIIFGPYVVTTLY